MVFGLTISRLCVALVDVEFDTSVASEGNRFFIRFGRASFWRALLRVCVCVSVSVVCAKCALCAVNVRQ